MGADDMDDEKLAAFASALADCTELDKFNDAALLRHLARRLLSLREENARYEAALQWYGEADRYEYDETCCWGTYLRKKEMLSLDRSGGGVLEDGGKRARTALTPSPTQRSEG